MEKQCSIVMVGDRMKYKPTNKTGKDFHNKTFTVVGINSYTNKMSVELDDPPFKGCTMYIEFIDMSRFEYIND